MSTSPSSIQEYMNQAIELALRAAEQDEVPVGALIIRQGEVIATGFNRREQAQQVLSHAEIEAISNASQVLKSWRLQDCSMIVTLEPCLMCLGAIQQARLDTVYYGAVDPKAGALSLGYNIHQDQRTNHRFEVIPFLDPRCGQMLTDFFRNKRKIQQKK